MGLSIGRIFTMAAAAVYGYYTGDWSYFAASASSAHASRVAKRDRRRAIAAYNSKLTDRLEMADVEADATRTLLMGRLRFVKGIRRRWSSGEFEEMLTMIVAFAGHECDGFEQWWLDDIDVELDVDGWVQPASLGTGSGYTTTAAGFAVGTTTIPLISGSGTILAGDKITFAGDATRYPVAVGITGPGSVELAAPGLVRPLPASAVAVKVFVHPYASAKAENVAQAVVLDEAGEGEIVMTSPYLAGTATVVWSVGDGDNQSSGTPAFSIAGSTVTITAGQPGATAWLNYSTNVTTSYVRIRPYLGTAAQNVGADLAAEHPGKIGPTDRFAGITLAAVTCKFNPDVFPQGRPTVSATLRGAKLYDQRLDSTAGGSGPHRLADPGTWQWSENPALQADHYARHPNGWALPAEEMRRSTIPENADVCDVSTEFTLRKTDDTTTTVTLPRYRCGIAIELDADPNSRRANMDAIMETMAGSDGWDGGTWCFRAGHKAAPAFTLESSWIAQRVGASGKPDKAEPVLRGAQTFSREQRINRVTGSCVDPDQRYQLLPFPAVEDEVLVAAKGTRPQEMVFEGVNHVAHAQHLASVIIRGAQAGTRIEAMCNLKAYRAQLFDVGTLLLPRHGMTVELGKTAEVAGRRWSPRGGIRLQLGEISDAMFDPLPELKGRDPAPDSSLRRPWDVERITGLAAAAGTAIVLADGTVVTQVDMTWNPATGANIRQGGSIEVQYTLATATLPPGDTWPSTSAPGDAVGLPLQNLRAGLYYLARARAVQLGPVVRGPWSETVSFLAQGSTATPSNVEDLQLQFFAGGVLITWEACPDLTYGSTDLHLEAVWSDATVPFVSVKGTSRYWPWPGDGTYTILAKHRDRSGNFSAAAAVAIFTITGHIVSDFSAYWYNEDDVLATWYADIEDPESGEVTGITPATWLTDATLDTRMLTDNIQPGATTHADSFSATLGAVVLTDADFVSGEAYIVDGEMSYTNEQLVAQTVEVTCASRRIVISSATMNDVNVYLEVHIDRTAPSLAVVNTWRDATSSFDILDTNSVPAGETVVFLQAVRKNISIPAGHTYRFSSNVYVAAAPGAIDPAATLSVNTTTHDFQIAVLKA